MFGCEGGAQLSNGWIWKVMDNLLDLILSWGEHENLFKWR